MSDRKNPPKERKAYRVRLRHGIRHGEYIVLACGFDEAGGRALAADKSQGPGLIEPEIAAIEPYGDADSVLL